MKKVFMIFVAVFLFASCANTSSVDVESRQESDVIKQYRKQIKDCDIIADYDLEFGDLSTSGMNTSVDKQIRCYETVVHQILDTYYKTKAIEMKNDLSNLKKTYYKMSLDTKWPDYCLPTCGTITTSAAYAETLGMFKDLINAMLYSIDIGY